MGYNPVMGTMIDLSKAPKKTATAEEAFSRSHPDTEIIHLQNYDNFYSLMDRLHQRDMSGQGCRQFLLIWPAVSRVLETPTEFGKLRGWCLRHGYQAALIIPKDDVSRIMAAEQGLPAFSTIAEAGKADWEIRDSLPEADEDAERVRRLMVLKKDHEQSLPVPLSFGSRLLIFLLLLAVMAGTAYVILPQAKVEITPYLTRKSVDMTIWTNDRLDTVTMGGGIPTIEKKQELTLQAAVPATGQVRVEPSIATGRVAVRNTCTRTYRANPGFEISTAEDIESGIRFLTLESLALEPEEERYVRVEAASGGTGYNLPAGSLQFAAYPQSACLEIRQDQPMSGGAEGLFSAPTAADLTVAREEIRRQVSDAFRNALENDPDGKDLLLLGDPVIASVKQEQVTPEIGFASETLTVRETLDASVKVVRRSDMEAIIRGQMARLNAQVGSMTGYEILSGPTEENGLSRWSVRAEYLVYEPGTNEDALQIMLRGKTLSQARKILDTLEHVRESRVTLLPSFLHSMPLLSRNIRVIFYPAVEAEP